ncbi:hypothetical protein RJ640_002660 [Escallonia rubra]|uniref:WAT1-related protein n=1 Tax=Escallonia rubra TaxID=112253 RepID=A0AA88SB65_9ASTE|nr:hypothetical protein RJ640_002660 [Escallonia rubra]
MGKIWNAIHGLKPAMMMVIVQIALAGVSVFYKLASNDGMSMRVMVAYRFLFAAAFVVPLALYVERGSMAQNLYAESLVLTSATFASATTNLVPAITFVMAVFFRLEKVGLGTKTGKAKAVGTLMGIGGAMLPTFYKEGWRSTSGQQSLTFCIMDNAKLSQRYPYHYSSTALIAVMGSLQGVVFALCVERDWSQWRLGWDIRLFTVVYTVCRSMIIISVHFGLARAKNLCT